MVSAVALGRQTTVRPSGVPDLFERVFGGQDFQLDAYTEPHVIMERLATDFPEPLTTRFYTSAYAERNNLQPTGKQDEQVFQFPDGFTLETIVQRFQTILRTASVPHQMAPESVVKGVVKGTEVVTFKYIPKYPVDSSDYANIFLPLLYGALGFVIREFQGKQVQEKPNR